MLSLIDLVQSSRLARVAKVRLAAATVALVQPHLLQFLPVTGHAGAIVTHLDFLVPSPYLCGRAISRVGSLTATAATYATVATWTVTSGRSGRLTEIALDSNNFAKTNWQLTIGGVQQWTAFNPRSALSLPFRDVLLPPGTVVLLQAASTDGTSITAYGSITGNEFFDHIFQVNFQKPDWMCEFDYPISQELVDRGIPLFMVITRESGLNLEVTNVNGLGDEPFAATIELYNFTTERRLQTCLDVIDRTYNDPLRNQIPKELVGRGR